MNYFDKNSPLQSLIPALRDLLTSPKAFFAELPGAAFHSNALFFASAPIFFATFISVPFYGFLLWFLLPVSWGLSLIGLWMWSRYMAWAVRTVAKGKLGNANSFQISAYAFAPMALASIPYIGIIGVLWNLYLLWTALVNRCKLSSGMALLIIGVPTIVVIASLVALSGMLIQLFPQLGQV